MTPRSISATNAGDRLLVLNDCWNTIGVQGDRSCSELAGFVHCRNCGVYTDAAIQILEARPAGNEVLSEDTASYQARVKSTSIVTFRLGAEYLALPTASIEEVSAQCPVHTLPHRSSKLATGLVNIRGELLIFVALGAMLRIEPAAPVQESARTRMRHVVVAHGGSRFVFTADEVLGVLEYQPGELAAFPATLPAAHFTSGLLRRATQVIACLDPDLLTTAVHERVA